MKEIPLNQGYVALVDDQDYEWLSQWKWTAIVGVDGSIQAARRTTVGEGLPRKQIAMHRAILNAPDGLQVDHINHHSLDNRRSNLRLCTQSQNNMNQRRNKRNTSGYKGAYWHAPSHKWAAKIQVDGRSIWLGCFDSVEDAAKAYREASAQYHGAFGLTD